ncbi:NAD(P)H-binding protein [Epidermidibacterium keratini]|uniref:NAD(P)H-binding protein n=1 Tax=Epidermidibacterium keratini TaxID=1891644 RepID=A0A7L4YMJ7_9ACTN|nr:SDR family oxidoreductase [Epidermidibacterium keratini]QHC00282.1 NAD(P)H-binding protein [Epidermidibacterium keratini]
MAKVLLIGGHGKVALLTAPLLVQAGDEVTSLIRNPDQTSDVAETGAQPEVADVESMSTDELAELMRGYDAVVWSAGAGGGDPKRTYAVDRDAAIRSMDAASQAGVRRYVMVSYFGAGPEHGVAQDDSFFAYADAKAAADAYLKASDLDWTIVAPSRLTLDEPTGKIAVKGRDDAAEQGKVSSRANVAQVIAAVLADDSTNGQMIEFVDGATPIAEAIRG